MTQLPIEVSTILASQGLELEHVTRDGPRYWVGLVRHSGAPKPLILKVVIQDEVWESTNSGRYFRPSDQLRIEIAALEHLGGQMDALSGRVPAMHASSLAGPVWSLRQVVDGADMAVGNSPFVFAERFYTEVAPEAIIDYVLSYQRLTPGLREEVVVAPRSHQADLAAKMYVAGLHDPQPRLLPFAPALTSYLEARRELHDTAEGMLTHGELYPPHIFIDAGEIYIIDWENASLDNRLHDLAAVWVRSFGSSAWQGRFAAELQRRGPELGPNWQQLWDLEVAYQAAGSLNYLDWSQAESPADQQGAAAWLQANLEAVLARDSAI